MSLSNMDQVPPQPVSDTAYVELRRMVTSAGLFKRAYRYYFIRSTESFVLLAIAVVILFVLPATYGWTVVAAFLLGFSLVQIGLIGHDSAHLAVFRGARPSWLLGQFCWSLLLGVGFWYWHDRHNRHHGHTNDVAEDPDIYGSGLFAIARTEEGAALNCSWRLVVKYPIFFVALGNLLVTLVFRVEGWLFTLRRLRGGRRLFEVVLLLLNILLWATLILVLGWRGIGILIASQFVASVYFAAIIAPNHKGMRTWPKDTKPSFLERQVLSSRNITPHPVWDFVFGGLNYQIEHHLFPMMPRVNLSRARAIVKPFCAAHSLPYDEVNPLTSYRMAYKELLRINRTSATE